MLFGANGKYELKYCERCGALGIRQSRSSRVYCNECQRKMGEVNFAPSPYRPRTAAEPANAARGRDESHLESGRWL